MNEPHDPDVERRRQERITKMTPELIRILNVIATNTGGMFPDIFVEQARAVRNFINTDTPE